MRILNSLLFFFLSSFTFIQAQSVPISPDVHDQLVQGPCHIFSTVAAMESRALQSGCNQADFLEWNLYSDFVLGGSGGGSQLMVEGVVFAAGTTGLFQRSDAPSIPTSASMLPNLNDNLVPGIARFNGSCSGTDMRSFMYEKIDGQTNCTDDDGSSHILVPIIGNSLVYNHEGSGFVEDITPTEQEIQTQLSLGNGIIAVFDNWRDPDDDRPGTRPVAHSVFIFSKDSRGWGFKDSWPGNPGNKTMATLPPPCGEGVTGTCLFKTYHLTGKFSCKVDCSGQLTGSQNVIGNTTYTLEGTDAGDAVWSVSNNLTVISQSGSSITVAPADCTSGPGEITVFYNNSECKETIKVNVPGTPSAPTDILIFSPNWSNGITCTNEVLELNVVDNNLEDVTYEWLIIGASSNPNNNTAVNFVTTNSGDNVPLTFQVRAVREGCPPGDWVTITGIAMDCSGGGGQNFVTQGGQLNYKSRDNSLNGQYSHYRIYSTNGKLLSEGMINDNSTILNLGDLSSQLLIIHLHNPLTGLRKAVKYLHMSN